MIQTKNMRWNEIKVANEKGAAHIAMRQSKRDQANVIEILWQSMESHRKSKV